MGNSFPSHIFYYLENPTLPRLLIVTTVVRLHALGRKLGFPWFSRVLLIKSLGKSVKGFMSYDPTSKQTNSDQNFMFLLFSPIIIESSNLYDAAEIAQGIASRNLRT